MTPFDKTIQNITEKPTRLYGLNFFPDLEPFCSNDQDSPACGWPDTNQEVSDSNLDIVRSVITKLGASCNAILEIGVDRNTVRSMSRILMLEKPTHCKYLGVDIEDKSYLNDLSKNIYTIQANSHDKVKIRSTMKSLGIENIDILLIDGWHSVNTCINDWGYVDLLSNYGAVILHDTNAHPGCIALYHAVDPELFVKERYCTENNDMGISVFWHKK